MQTPDETDASVEIVVTVPAPHGAEFAHAVGARTTLGVLIEILAGAKRRVVLAAPFLQQAHGLSDPRVATAIQSCLQRGVQVDVVSTREGLATLDKVELRKNPRAKLRFFRPEANMEHEWHIGSHAKFCIADSDAAYIGSANFTGPALDGQLELGLLVRGKVARQIAAFWGYCLRRGVFVLVE